MFRLYPSYTAESADFVHPSDAVRVSLILHCYRSWLVSVVLSLFKRRYLHPFHLRLLFFLGLPADTGNHWIAIPMVELIVVHTGIYMYTYIPLLAYQKLREICYEKVKLYPQPRFLHLTLLRFSLRFTFSFKNTMHELR